MQAIGWLTDLQYLSEDLSGAADYAEQPTIKLGRNRLPSVNRMGNRKIPESLVADQHTLLAQTVLGKSVKSCEAAIDRD